MNELRVVIGERLGPKFSIWKFCVQGDEIYVISRMFGEEAKVSLHQSGECQWSCTGKWVVKHGARNADRHMAKWKVTYPDGLQALLVLCIAIPLTEVRVATPPEDQEEVLWIGNAPSGSTVQLLVFVTCAQDEQPETDGDLNLRHVASMQLRNKRWVCIFAQLISLSSIDIAELRELAVKQAQDAGIEIQPEYRLACYAPPSDSSSAALLRFARQRNNPLKIGATHTNAYVAQRCYFLSRTSSRPLSVIHSIGKVESCWRKPLLSIRLTASS